MKRLPAALALGAVAACGPATPSAPRSNWTPPTGPRSSAEYVLDFEQTLVAVGGVLPTVDNAGTARVRTEVVTLSGGRATLAPGVGTGHGLRFPAFQGSGESPAAVLVVRADGASDVFSPADRDFRFGADFRLDDASEGLGSDNGDNLIQRGVFESDAQFKAQLDHGVPSCRVAGRGGVALVRAPTEVTRDHWYRVTCERRGDRITLALTDLQSSTATRWFHADVAVGEVRADSRQPLSVGGKLNEDGTISASSTDQFNGSVDNVFFELLP